MAKCCITWVNGRDYGVITEIIGYEEFLFTTIPINSQPCPLGANAALVRCKEGDALVSNTDLVTTTKGHRVTGDELTTFVAVPNDTRISAVKAPA